MQQLGQGYVELQMVHHELLREAFRSNEGRELRTEGDSFFCVFASALDACHAAAAAQQSFAEHRWPEGGALRVRTAVPPKAGTDRCCFLDTGCFLIRERPD